MGIFGKHVKGIIRRNTSIVPKIETCKTVGDLESALLAQFPACDAEKWDKTGLLIGDRRQTITGVAVALDANVSAVSSAASAHANVLLTHHPVFLESPTSIVPSDSGQLGSGPVIWEAVSEGISIMSFHTALDSSLIGNHMLPKMLSLDAKSLLHPLAHDEVKGYGTVCSFSKKEDGMTLAQLAARCLSVFGRPPRVWGDFNKKLHVVATCNGSANSIVEECAKQRIDCLVCGELGYHHALELSGIGICVIELGHDVSELPFIATLAASAERAGVDKSIITLINQSENWTCPESIRV